MAQVILAWLQCSKAVTMTAGVFAIYWSYVKLFQTINLVRSDSEAKRSEWKLSASSHSWTMSKLQCGNWIDFTLWFIFLWRQLVQEWTHGQHLKVNLRRIVTAIPCVFAALQNESFQHFHKRHFHYCPNVSFLLRHVYVKRLSWHGKLFDKFATTCTKI